MAACKSLGHIFDNTITENNSSSTSSLFNWKQIKPLKPPLDHSFTEIFGELHFKEHHSNPTCSSSSSSFFTPTFSSPSSSLSSLFSPSLSSPSPSYPDIANDQKNEKTGYTKPYHRKSNSFSSLNSDSLQLCTEGLGTESLGDIEDLLKTDNTNNTKDKMHVRRHSSDSTYSYGKFKRANEKAMFPPPISYIGQSGKQAVSFQSYRKDGRFVLKEVRIPTQECLQASREDGCLRLSFVQSDDDDDIDDDDDDNHDSEKVGEDDGRKEEEYEEKDDEVEVKDDVSKY